MLREARIPTANGGAPFACLSLQLTQALFQACLAIGLIIALLNHASGNAGDNGVIGNVLDNDSARCDNRASANVDAFEHHGVGADHDAVLDNHGCGACRLDNAREYGARANVAVLAHRGAAAQDGTHVDHGSIADDSADIDDGAHHDDGVVADGDAIANDRAGLDARVDALGVEQGHGGVAAVVLDLVVIDGVGVVLQDAGQLAPVTEDDLALAATEDMRALQSIR